MTRRKPSEYNWSKLQFDETILTKHFTAPRRQKIQFVVAHHMIVLDKDIESDDALDACWGIWQKREASAHYGVDGKFVRQFVWDSNAAWATADTRGNHAGISIEHANITLDETGTRNDYKVSTTTWKNGAKLAAHLHKVYKLGRPTSSGFGTGGTLRTHQSFFATACPGPFFREIWPDYVKEAQRVYDEITKTPTKPKPKPVPVPAGPVVYSASLNAGSYNGPGAKTYKTRVDKYAIRRLASRVDILNLQEVGNGLGTKKAPNCRMRGRLDLKLAPIYRRHKGSDGRYCYSNRDQVKPIASGVITAEKSTWYRKDDKQAAYVIYEKDGVRAMDVSLHLENEDGADQKRVEQMLSIESQAVDIAIGQRVDIRNILLTGDTNSEGMVAKAMLEAGWRNVATDGKYENSATFIGWDGKARKRYDYGFVHESAGPATLHALHADPEVGDHAELVIKRQLTKI